MNFSIAEENYIKSIYHLQQQQETVSTNAVAEALNTKPASVTDMLKRLQVKNILQYQRYKGFRLNTTGNKIALGIIRKHRLWEYFLVTQLGFEWDKVHDIAEELEHVSSHELIKRLDAFLQYPTTDPHGDPIPDGNGKIPVIHQQSITDIPVKQTVTVSSVGNQSAQMLDILKHHRIGIGSKIRINKHFSFDESIEIKVDKQPLCTISKQVAKNIFVYGNC